VKHYSRLLFVISALFCATLLIISHSPAGLVIKFFLGKLMYSTSNGAALFMLTICTIGILVLGINRPPSRLSNFALLALPLILCVGFLLHGLATAYYLIHFNLPFGPYFLHWRNGANSYTSPFHSHLGKVAIDFIAQSLDLGLATRFYDMGGVFRGIVSDSFALALGVCFLLGCLAAVSALPILNRRYADHCALPMLYICCAAAALKNLLDGGFLAQPAPVVCVIIIFLSMALDAGHLRCLLIRYWSRGLLVIAITLLPLVIRSGEGPLPNLTELLVALAIVVLVLAVSLNHKIGKLAWLSTSYLLAAIAVDARYNLFPLLNPLNQDAKIFQVETAKTVPFSTVANVDQLYRESGDSAVKSRWLLIANQQQQGSRELLFFIHPLAISGTKGSFTVQPAFVDVSMKRVPGHQDWFALYVRIREDLPPARIDGIGDLISHNNAYVYMHAVARMLTGSGINEFIMMPVTRTNPIPPEFLDN
jgi:hypothetical protein